MYRMEHMLEQREYEVEKLRKRIKQEKQLLERLKEGLLDGVIKNNMMDGEFTRIILIEEGRPMFAKYLTEKGPIKDAMIIEKEFLSDDAKLWFLRNHGLRMEDVYAQLYSYMYRRSYHP